MAMGFKNPIDYKGKYKTPKSWNFDAPQYDNRTSRGIDAGYDSGVGHKQPVGHSGKVKDYAVPMGRQKTLSPYGEI